MEGVLPIIVPDLVAEPLEVLAEDVRLVSATPLRANEDCTGMNSALKMHSSERRLVRNTETERVARGSKAHLVVTDEEVPALALR